MLVWDVSEEGPILRVSVWGEPATVRDFAPCLEQVNRRLAESDLRVVILDVGGLTEANAATYVSLCALRANAREAGVRFVVQGANGEGRAALEQRGFFELDPEGAS